MFEKCLEVCKLNKSLKDRISELLKENEALKRDANIDFRFQIAEKKENIQKLKAEMEYTQKTLKMINSGTSKLEHVLYMGKPC